jgi:membrane-bound lytic murein transglycosylase D
MSFTYNLSAKSWLTNSGDGEKDSIKGFRNLLVSNINPNNTTVLFELNTKVVPFVNDYIKKQSGNLEEMRSWGQPYFMIYEHILSSNALPVELKYLSVVESNLQAGAVSMQAPLAHGN